MLKTKMKILKKLEKEILHIENKIKHPIIYNMKSFLIKVLLEIVSNIDICIFTCFTIIIILNSFKSKNMNPFIKEEFKEYAFVETIETSNGYINKTISYEKPDNIEKLEFSTRWVINEYGLYERTITSYRLNEHISLAKIFTMSKEELDNTFVIENIQTVQKSKIVNEEKIYDEDMIILIKVLESTEEFAIRKETTLENVLDGLYYTLSVIFVDAAYVFISVKLKNKLIKDKIDFLNSKWDFLKKEDLIALKKVLEIQKENLALLTDGLELNENNYCRKLIKSGENYENK